MEMLQDIQVINIEPGRADIAPVFEDDFFRLPVLYYHGFTKGEKRGIILLVFSIGIIGLLYKEKNR